MDIAVQIYRPCAVQLVQEFSHGLSCLVHYFKDDNYAIARHNLHGHEKWCLSHTDNPLNLQSACFKRLNKTCKLTIILMIHFTVNSKIFELDSYSRHYNTGLVGCSFSKIPRLSTEKN